MKKLIAKILTLTMMTSLISYSAFAQNEGSYTDVSTNDWYYNSVNFVSENKIMTGVSETEFSPLGLMSRAMFVTALYRMEGEPAFMNANVFSDVPSGSYYEKAVVWANGRGIINGISDNIFAPNKEITREQIAKIIVKYAEYKNANTSVTTDVSNFSDFETDVSDYACDAIKYCIGEGIITGKSETEIAPKDNATRAEVATILERVYSLLEKDDDIVILYTNDVHCATSKNIGYAGLAAYKKRMEQTNGSVLLVDSGDFIQGGVVGYETKGEEIIDIMNTVGYDFVTFGNHEFNFGIDNLSHLMNKLNSKVISSNVSYKGENENKLKESIPYEIVSCGDKKIGFVAFTTPESLITATPMLFMENDKTVYEFSGFDELQIAVDECKKNGADFVIALSHSGDDEVYKPYDSKTLIGSTHDIDVVLDAHAHNKIASQIVKNSENKDVILTSSGTELENIGVLTIDENNVIKTRLVSDYKGKDIETDKQVKATEDRIDNLLSEVIGNNTCKLSIKDDEGVRMIRTREMPIGDLCSDAFRIVFDADIGIINGGGIRADVPIGEVTKKDMVAVNSFGNEVVIIKAKGKNIQDALEWANRDIKSEYKKDGKPFGEEGGFLQISGIKCTVNTSIPSPVTKDVNNLFTGVSGERRIFDIFVLNKNGEYEPLDLEKEYIVASTDYILLNHGDGETAFDGCELIEKTGLVDNNVLIKYVVEHLKGDFDKYNSCDNRITIK